MSTSENAELDDLIDLTTERLARIDERIDSHGGEALRDRWEFGRTMLAARDGKGRLPNPTESEPCNAVAKFAVLA